MSNNKGTEESLILLFEFIWKRNDPNESNFSKMKIIKKWKMV